VILEFATLAILIYASLQDVRTREIDSRVILSMFVPASIFAAENLDNYVYWISPIAGALLAMFMRMKGSGYADSLAILALGFSPPVAPYLPTPLLVVLGSTAGVASTALWLYNENSKRPCRMKLWQKFAYVCASREEVAKYPHRYIIGEAEDLEKYEFRTHVDEEWVIAKYGAPYLLYVCIGYSIYVVIRIIAQPSILVH